MQKAVLNLNNKLRKQGFVVETLKRKFQQFSTKYIHLWSKFGEDITSENYLNAVFPPDMSWCFCIIGNIILFYSVLDWNGIV